MEKNVLQQNAKMNNTLTRTLSGAVFGAVVITANLLFPPLFPAVVIIAIYLMMGEFYGFSMGSSYVMHQKLFILAAELLFAIFFCCRQYGIENRWLLLSIIPMMAAMTALLFDKDREQLFKFPYLFAGLMYIGIPTALVPLVVFRDGGFDGWLLMSFILIIWASDIGAYFIGSMLGQKPDSRKLAPEISPKKSWWGVWGGLVLSVIVAGVICAVGWLDIPMVHALVLGVIVSAAGVCGDLFESLWKRYFHVKDSGNVIPGHGGLLDRFDSSLFAIPLGTAYLAIFNLL